MPSHKSTETPCACGAARGYSTCCGRYHAGDVAPTAEALMRARYCAYVLALEPYLLATWHASTRPPTLGIDNERTMGTPTRWLGLDIRRWAVTGPDSAIVEFVARYKTAGRAHRLHETSRFVREHGLWYYLDGDFNTAAKTARG